VVVACFAYTPAGVAQPESQLFDFCFAPDTPANVVKRAYSRAGLVWQNHSLSDTSDNFQLTSRWSRTATDGSGLQQGEPTTLTWSIVPDGTGIPGYNGEPSNPSNLRAFLDGIYGAVNWLPIFQQVFDRWAELSGLEYVYEPNDDGSDLASQSGQLGVRADVRIGGHLIDGNSGILAYNFYPNNGDMVLDTDDNYYTNTSSASLRLRNILAHEHGHGMGLRHVCPKDRTKIMEPYITTLIDGPQHDDILAANRHYGDVSEDDDTPGTAAMLGSLVGGTRTLDLSIDDNSDVDYFEFTLAGATAVSVSVTPVGFQYLQGPQDQSCSTGALFNSLPIHDLTLRLLDSTESPLATADATGAGSAEELANIVIPGGSGYVEVDGDFTDDVQLYRLEVSSGDVIFEDDFESGDVAAWSSSLQ